MAGFFKKLFNRITGKPGEEPAPALEQAALPPPDVPVIEAPLPMPPPLPVEVEMPPSRAIEDEREEVPFEPEATLDSRLRGNDDVEKKVETKKLAAKKVADKKEPAKKEVPKKEPPKKEAAKKAAVKKAEPPKPEPKKIEAKKPAPAKPEKAKPVPATKPVVEKPAPLPQGDKEEQSHAVPTWDILPSTQQPEPPSAAEASAAPVAEDHIEAANIPAIPDEPSRGGWFSRLRSGLSKSSQSITGSITSIFTKRKLDRETLQELEDTLIQADLGVTVSERIIAAVSQGRYDKEIDPEEVKSILAAEVAKVLKPVEVPFNFGSEKPFVIMVVGVNGSGKTTTIGKLGSIAAAEGFKVMFAACDTFRAAAIEQLTVWCNRIGAATMSAPQGADAAGLAFDAIKAAQGNGTDILFIDTAGRLQNKAYLMDELDKVVRVIKKLDPAAPHAVLLVLDATTGQNALAQAEIFTKVAGVTGLIMTKLDGTARGGILVAIAEKFKLPIHAIGVGESIADLQPFDAQGFARAIAGFDEE
jgi:fused signal recognition particle receptor